VSEDAITFFGEHNEAIHVPCRSLNHAYVLASLRFERGRKSRGGRVYENLSFFHPRRNQTLDWARMDAERGGSKFINPRDVHYPIHIPWDERAGNS